MTFSGRIKNLNRYQKCFLLIMLLMSLVFTILYPITISRVGYEYMNSILVPTQENNNIIYDSYWLYNEDGTDYEFSYVAEDETEQDADGNFIDPDEPSAGTILELMNDPLLTHKGNWTAWFGAVAICLLNAFSILFAEEIFRWNLMLQIRDANNAEPSELEIVGRYLSWSILIVAALILFIIGLQ